MKPRFRDHINNTMQIEAYEMLSLPERAKFIKSQNPMLKRSVCVSGKMKKKFGAFYWSYKMNNGWRCFASKSEAECIAKYRDFMERAENELSSDQRA